MTSGSRFLLERLGSMAAWTAPASSGASPSISLSISSGSAGEVSIAASHKPNKPN